VAAREERDVHGSTSMTVGRFPDDFLPDLDPRSWSAPKGSTGSIRTSSFFLGQGDHPLEVALGTSQHRPRADDVRALWKSRQARRPSPVLLVVGYETAGQSKVAVCGLEDPTLEDWEAYWRRLYRLQRTHELWTYWPPLLVVTDPIALIPPDWLMRIDPIPSYRRTTAELRHIKGLEYQHVLMLLSEQTFATLNSGFTGSGQRNYDLIRLYRIPFSRAKDSLVTFVFPGDG
jgi:hypothetical protein